MYEKEFARFYDVLVYDREEVEAGEREITFLEWTFRQCPLEVNHILDVGCGSGRFLIPLTRKGYNVTGLDISKDMLEECARRLKKQNLRTDLIHQDLKTMDFDSKFDALLCMDSVISYFLETEEIINILKRFHRALRPQGVLIIENWNMFAQWELLGPPRSYVHVNDKNKNKVEWEERSWYDTFTSIFHTEIRGVVHEEGGSYPFHHEEVLRATTVGEMSVYLKEAGFSHQVCYPSYELSEANSVNGDIMLFVAMEKASSIH